MPSPGLQVVPVAHKLLPKSPQIFQASSSTCTVNAVKVTITMNTSNKPKFNEQSAIVINNSKLSMNKKCHSIIII